MFRQPFRALIIEAFETGTKGVVCCPSLVVQQKLFAKDPVPLYKSTWKDQKIQETGGIDWLVAVNFAVFGLFIVCAGVLGPDLVGICVGAWVESLMMGLLYHVRLLLERGCGYWVCVHWGTSGRP